MIPAISAMVKETTEREHSGEFFGIDDGTPQSIDFGINLSSSTSTSWEPLFVRKVEEEDAMQEMHHEMEMRTATREAMTTAMIGADL
jgi:hypothetical protein